MINDRKLNYVKEQCRSYKVLSQNEEKEIIKKAQAGDKDAQDQLFRHNYGLIAKEAEKYSRKDYVSIDDLFQEGAIGLMLALKKFDLSKGIKFATYATYWIRHEILNYIQDKVKIIRQPRLVEQTHTKIRKWIQEQQINGIKVEPYDIAKVWDVTVEVAHRLLTNTSAVISYDVEVENENGDCESLLNMIPSDESLEEIIDELLLQEDIFKALSKLEAKERYVIVNRYNLNNEGKKTLKNISENLGVSIEWVRILEQNALNKLRTQIAYAG